MIEFKFRIVSSFFVTCSRCNALAFVFLKISLQRDFCYFQCFVCFRFEMIVCLQCLLGGGGFRAEGDKNVPTKKAVFYILSPHFNILVKQFPFLRLSLLGQANNGPSNLTSNVFIQWVSKKNRSPWTRIHRCISSQLNEFFFRLTGITFLWHSLNSVYIPSQCTEQLFWMFWAPLHCCKIWFAHVCEQLGWGLVWKTAAAMFGISRLWVMPQGLILSSSFYKKYIKIYL